MIYVSKNSSVYTSPTKNISDFNKGDCLLWEIGGFLLQEDGDNIVLNPPLLYKHLANYTSPNKNTNTANNETITGQFYLSIDGTYELLIDTEDKLLIQPLNISWTYATKN